MTFRFFVKGFCVPFVGFFCGPGPMLPANFRSSRLHSRRGGLLFDRLDAIGDCLSDLRNVRS